MALFTQDLATKFRSDQRIVKALTYIDDKKIIRKISLLTLEEFKQWYTPAVVKRSLRIRNAAPLNRFPGRDNNERFHREALADRILIRDLVAQVCQGNIADIYGQSTVERLLRGTSTFDVLIAVDPFYLKPDRAQRTGTVLNHKLQHVLGFVIAELGECKKHPLTYSINLICSRSVNGAKIGSIVLLGAFIYCIKNSASTTINKDEGILELAGGYDNMPGFISYTKMGFIKDLTLFGDDCFGSYANLPMKVNIKKLDNEEIIDRAAGLSRPIITIDQDDSGLFNARKDMTPKDKRKLILLNNIKYKLDISNDLMIDLGDLLETRLLDDYKRRSNDINEIKVNIDNDIIGILSPAASKKRSKKSPILSIKSPFFHPALSKKLSKKSPILSRKSPFFHPALSKKLSKKSPALYKKLSKKSHALSRRNFP
jgi:hypothetical protein